MLEVLSIEECWSRGGPLPDIYKNDLGMIGRWNEAPERNGRGRPAGRQVTRARSARRPMLRNLPPERRVQQ